MTNDIPNGNIMVWVHSQESLEHEPVTCSECSSKRDLVYEDEFKTGVCRDCQEEIDAEIKAELKKG